MELAVEILSGVTESKPKAVKPVKEAKAGKGGGKDGKNTAGGAGGAAGAEDDKGKSVAEVLPVDPPPTVEFHFNYILSIPNNTIRFYYKKCFCFRFVS